LYEYILAFTMWKYLAAWFPMLILAVMNGAVREVLYKASLGDLRAHQLSTVALLILFSLYIWLVIRFWRPASSQQAFLVGLLWLVLTLIFEFGSGLSAGRSWSALFGEYNVLAGRIWVFIPAWVAAAPCIFFRLQK
jgi:hypothetical protein